MIDNIIMLSVDFSPIKPDFGLIFWTFIFFTLFWLLIGKSAFKPIANALKERSNSIDEALRSAEQAKEEMAQLQAQNELILQEAREERSKMLKDANEVKNKIISEAKEEAKLSATKIIEDARADIESQRLAAISGVKSEMGAIAVEIAEKVVQKELGRGGEQEQLVASLLEQVDFSNN